MWKVDQTSVYSLIGTTDNFVRDFFDWAINNRGKPQQELEMEIEALAGPLGNLARNLAKLRDLMIEFANCPELQKVKHIYECHTQNYQEILEIGVDKVCETSVSSDILLKKTFKYFYESLVESKSFWMEYHKDLKIMNKREFRKEIGGIRQVCPYCDMNSIAYELQSNSDHYLPFHKFPLLAIHWANLVVSCTACNQQIKGSSLLGTSSFSPILHPYFHQVADYFSFTFQNEQIQLKSNPGNDEHANAGICNFWKVFHTEKVYARQQVVIDHLYTRVCRAVKSRYKSGEGLREVSIREIFREEVLYIQEDIHSCIGQVGMTKLLFDYCRFLLLSDNLEEHIERLSFDLGVPYVSSALMETV